MSISFNKSAYILSFSFLLAGLGSCSTGAFSDEKIKAPMAYEQSAFSLHIDSDRVGAKIPLDFVGISFETSALVQSIPLNENVKLKRILSVLGRNGSFRFGGDTVDRIVPPIPRVTDAANFVDSFGPGWSMIFGLSCTKNDAKIAVTESAAANAVLGKRVTFQIGNEPNVYKDGPCSGGFSNYYAVWQSISKAVSAAVPSASFAGPDGEFSTNVKSDAFLPLFAARLPARVTLLTEHTYGSGATGSVADDVTSAWTNRIASSNFELIPKDDAVVTSRLPIRLTESGSIGGKNVGIANTLGASIYDLWEMIMLAQNHWSGVNFHNGDAGSGLSGYAPVQRQSDGVYAAQSTLYSMVMFNYLVGGAILPVTASPLPSGVAQIAVKGEDGKVRILIVNKNLTSDTTTKISTAGKFSTASALFFTADSYKATDVALGGATINADGSFNPSFMPLPVDGSVAIVRVPPSSAVMVTFDRGGGAGQ